MNNNGWFELVNKALDGTVGTGTENYRAGVITATTFYGDGSNLTGTGSGYATTAGIATLARGLTGSPNITVGVVTATSFIGDGSGITGVTASGTGIIIKEGGTLVGTIGTVDFGTGLSVSPCLLYTSPSPRDTG